MIKDAAIAQQDIAQYYDSLNVLSLARWCIEHGLPAQMAAATVRQQLLAPIRLSSQTASIGIRNRSFGGLTGSRVAGALGCIPVERVILEKQAIWNIIGFDIGRTFSLTVAVYAGNIFSAFTTTFNATKILD